MSKERVEYEVVGRDVGGSKAFKDVGDAAEKAGDKVDHAGDQADGASKEYRGLAASIAVAQAEMKRLAVEIDKTGNMDLAKDLRSQQRELRKLMDIRKAMGDSLDLGGGGKSGKGKGGLLDFAIDEWAARAGRSVADGLEGGIQSAGRWASSNPLIAGAIAAGITLGAPVIGAAVIGAVGAGVIAGGIFAAAQDPRVGQAWKALGESAKGKLTGAADGFVDPLIHGAETFGDTLDRILPNLERDFNRLAPVTDRLFDGAAGFTENLMPGIDALTTQAGPMLTMVANELPRMGTAVSQMMEAIASGGEGGKQALHDLLVLTEALIISTGNGIMVFEQMYQAERAVFSAWSGDFGGAVRSWQQLIYGTEALTPVAGAVAATFDRVAAAMIPVGREAELTGDQFKTLAGQISAARQDADALAGQMVDKMLGSMMSMDQAVLGFAESQTRISESIKDNGRQLDIHTAKGQANREAILGAVQANIGQYDAMMRAGAGADEASKAYDVNTKALEDQLRQAGFTQGEIDNLIGKYRGVPATVDTDIAMHGLAEAIGSLDDAIRMANGLDGRHVDTYFTAHFDQTGNTRPGGGGSYAFSTGGLMRGPGTGTSDDIVARVSDGEYVVRAAAVRALGVGALDRINQADRNPGALTTAAASSGGGVAVGPRRNTDREFARLIAEEFGRALSQATLRIDDRTGRIVDLYTRAG